MDVNGKQQKPVSKLSFRKRVLFIIVLVIIIFEVFELFSFGVWSLTLDESAKESIGYLCGETIPQPVMLPNTFWHHTPNPKREHSRINTKGTLGNGFDVPKPDGEFRIICLGDSTVEGFGLPVKETFPYLLEHKMRPLIQESSLYDKVRVINAGISSHNSAFNLAYLQFRLLHYMPDVVVIKSSFNDYVPYCMPGMQYDYTHAYPNPYHFYRNTNPYWRLADYSYAFKVLGFYLFNEEVTLPFRDFWGSITREQIEQMDFSFNDDKFSIYAENIRSMILLCKGRNIRVFVLDLPTSPNPKHHSKFFGKEFRELVGRFELELQRITAEEGVPLIKTGPLGNDDFFDHCHPTLSGNTIITQHIVESMTETLELQ